MADAFDRAVQERIAALERSLSAAERRATEAESLVARLMHDIAVRDGAPIGAVRCRYIDTMREVEGYEPHHAGLMPDPDADSDPRIHPRF